MLFILYVTIELPPKMKSIREDTTSGPTLRQRRCRTRLWVRQSNYWVRRTHVNARMREARARLTAEERTVVRRAHADAMREARARLTAEERTVLWRVHADTMREARARARRTEEEAKRERLTKMLFGFSFS